MADFVRYLLDDGTEVYFEASEGTLVGLRSGEPDIVDGGNLTARLAEVTAAANVVSQGLRSRLNPDELEVGFGVKLAGSVNFWFFAKADGESSIDVKLTWKAKDLEQRP